MCTFLIQRYVWISNRLSEDNRGIWRKGFQGWKVFDFKIFISSDINECWIKVIATIHQSLVSTLSGAIIVTVEPYIKIIQRKMDENTSVKVGEWISNYKFAVKSNTQRLEQRTNSSFSFFCKPKQINTLRRISSARITTNTSRFHYIY